MCMHVHPSTFGRIYTRWTVTCFVWQSPTAHCLARASVCVHSALVCTYAYAVHGSDRQLEKDDLANDLAYAEIVADTRDELLTFGALTSLIVPRPDPFVLAPPSADDECA